MSKVTIIASFMLYFALWLVQKNSHPSLNQSDSKLKTNQDFVTGVFPRFRKFGCFLLGLVIWLWEVEAVVKKIAK